jgi:N-acyl-D-aspartate/D-glutamate deacylase
MRNLSTRRRFLQTSLATGASLAGACMSSACRSSLGAAEPFDVILRGGTLVDGTGRPAVISDLGIRGDRIAHVGTLAGAATARIIDARGLVVAPGFIDVHAHSDLRRHPLAQSKVAQGVTFDVCGPDGGSPFPRAADESGGSGDAASGCDSHAEWERQHPAIAIDIGAYVGHGTLRQRVLGPVGRAPTDRELAAMQDLVRQALEQGAMGLSSGLEYFPGNAAATPELIALAEVAAAFDRPYVTHIRNEDDRLLEAVDEAIEIARRSGASLLISHLKVGGRPNWHKLDALLERIEKARAEGLEVRCDCYPYEAWSTSLATNFPGWAKDGGKFVARLQDPAERTRMRAETEQAVAANGGWGVLMLGAGLARADRDLLGKRIDAAAQDRGVAPFELACDLLTRGSVSILGFGIDAAQMDRILAQPWCIVASDGSAVAATGRTGHPRSFGTFPRVIRRHVREQKLLSIEAAVHKMTALPAQALRRRDRGTLAEGLIANVVAFDAEHFTDHATWLEPQRYAEGVRYLLVNGVLTVDGGRQTEARAGRVIG